MNIYVVHNIVDLYNYMLRCSLIASNELVLYLIVLLGKH
jgi:hypothetical protein